MHLVSQAKYTVAQNEAHCEDCGLLLEFASEASEFLESIESDILSLETGLSRPAVDRIFRALHTIKGNASFFDLDHVSGLAHTAESALDRIRMGQLEPSADLVETLLQTRDYLAKATLKPTCTEKFDRPEFGDHANLMDRLGVLLKIEQEFPDASPPPNGPETSIDEAGPSASQPTAAPQDNNGNSEDERNGSERSMRVPESRITDVVSGVGDLLRVTQQLNALRSVVEDQLADAVISRDFRRALAALDDSSEALLRSGVNLSKVPVDRVVGKLQRIVRDICRSRGSQATLVVDGSGVEIDRSLAEALDGPILHMIRNAADHGIELPEVRVEGGKDPKGTITIAFSDEGNWIHMKISDDGGGLDPDKLRKRALERGLVAPDEVLNDKEALDLIFLPGFSTATTVSQFSGRGVGMDVVRRSIEAVGGSVSLDSHLGQGTDFSIRLEKSVETALQSVLTFRVGESFFVLPAKEVIEIRQVSRKRQVSIGTGRALWHKDELFPLIDLHSLLGIHDPSETDESQLVILRTPAGPVALAIDEALEHANTVVLRCPYLSRTVPLYSGVTLLGNSTLALAFEPAQLLAVAKVELDPRQDARPKNPEIEEEIVNSSYLIFVASDRYEAIELDMVNRIERLDSASIQTLGSRQFMLTGSQATPLVELRGNQDLDDCAVILVHHNDREFGLMVDEIWDIRTNLEIDTTLATVSTLGAALVDSLARRGKDLGVTTQTVDIVDLPYLAGQVYQKAS